MAKQSMENVTRHAHLVDSKGFHGELHAVERSGLPDVVRSEIVSAFCRNRLMISFGSQLNRDLVGLVIGNFDDISNTFPVRAQFSSIFETHLVTNSKFDITEFKFRKNETREMLVIQAKIPSYDKAILGLRFLKLAVIVCLDFDQRTKDVLILICVVIA